MLAGERNGLSLQHRMAVRADVEVRLLIALVTDVAAVIEAIVVGAEDQHDDRWLDVRPQPPQQQIFLVGTVSRNAGGHDPVIRQHRFEQFGKALACFRIQSPDKGIAEEHDRRLLVAGKLLVTQSQTVVPNADGACVGHDGGGVGLGYPAKTGIVAIAERALARALAQLPEIANAQEDFEREQRRAGHDERYAGRSNDPMRSYPGGTLHVKTDDER